MANDEPSTRDIFAAVILHGILAGRDPQARQLTRQEFAHEARIMADALIAELNEHRNDNSR